MRGVEIGQKYGGGWNKPDRVVIAGVAATLAMNALPTKAMPINGNARRPTLIALSGEDRIVAALSASAAGAAAATRKIDRGKSIVTRCNNALGAGF
ncbi:hypothetical protein OAS86_05175 [Gammaproteobacteria bacterium]|nr:hypothetical protein [Gammaproteobacteria bacterium]